MDTRQWRLGIDFGTSNTAAAHTNPVKGAVEVINLSHSSTTMPSSVFIESREVIEVGDVALDRASANPAAFISSPKRLVSHHTFQVAGFDLESSIPIAAVLKSVYARALREHQGIPPEELVLTHPEAWPEEHIDVLRDAAADLGVPQEHIHTVSEPKAAAHYYSQGDDLQPGDKIGVFDFGGGTLDLAVLEAQPDGSFSVIVARGDKNLGGKTFDALIRRWVDTQLNEDDPELAQYMRKQAPVSERHALEDSIRRAKELLSEASSATITYQAAGETHRLGITREEFETIIAAYVDQAVDLTRRTLAEAGITQPSQVKALYLTGGSSRVPIIQEALKPLGPVATLDDPKTVVAQGALSAVTPVITHLTAHNTGGQPAPTPQPPQAAPQITAFAKVAPPQPAAPSARRRNTKLPLLAGVGVVGVAIVAAIGILVSQNTSTTTDQAAPQAVTTTTNSATSSTETNPAAVEGDEPRDKAINAIPESIKPYITTCTASPVSRSGKGAACEIALDTGAEEYFNLGRGKPIPKIYIASDEEAARYTRAIIRDEQTREIEKHYDPDTAQAYTIKEGYGGLGDVDLVYANTDTGLILEVTHLTNQETAQGFLEDHNLL